MESSIIAIISEERAGVARWDPGFTRGVLGVAGGVVRRYFRADVQGMDNMPASGGALVVSNHSGGMLTPTSWFSRRSSPPHRF